MSVTATAKRRRTQARNGYRHLSKKQRPNYGKRSAQSSDKRLRATIEKQKAIAARKGASRRG